MRKDKKERIKKLYLLERMVYEGKDKEGIERLRTELECNNFEIIKGKPKGSKHFDINRYIEAKEEYPKLTDNEIAALLDVSPQTLATAKRRNGLCKRQNTSENRFKRMQQVINMLEAKPDMSKSEIAKIFGVSRNCIKKDLRDYEEWSKRYGKVD